jgi:hypothetical protein
MGFWRVYHGNRVLIGGSITRGVVQTTASNFGQHNVAETLICLVTKLSCSTSLLPMLTVLLLPAQFNNIVVDG